MRGGSSFSGGSGRGRRGSGRAARDRAHGRPPGAESPAAESARRVAAALERVLAAKGVSVGDVALALAVRPIDVVRWRRGHAIPAYRRADLESRIGRLEVDVDPDTGEVSVRVRDADE